MKKFLLIICFLLVSFFIFADERFCGYWSILNDTPAVAIEILPDGTLFIVYYTGVEIKYKYSIKENLFFIGALGYYYKIDKNRLELNPAFGGAEMVLLERKNL